MADYNYCSSNSTCVSSSGNISASGGQPAQREGTIHNGIDIHSMSIESKLTKIHNECRDIKASNMTRFQKYTLMRRKNYSIIRRSKWKRSRLKVQQNPTLPGSSQDECIHEEVLREHVTFFVQNVMLTSTIMPDEMFQEGVLTKSEMKQILNGEDDEAKARKMIAIISRIDKIKFNDFIKILSKHFPHIGKAIKKSYEEKLKAENIHVKCIRCFIVKQVNIKKILDHLYEKSFIDLNTFEKLLKEVEEDIDQFWEESFQKMSSKAPFGEFYLKTFKEALQNHYSHIVKKIQNYDDLKCLCSDSSSHLSSTCSDEETSLSSISEPLERDSSIPQPLTSDPLPIKKHCPLQANVDEIDEN